MEQGSYVPTTFNLIFNVTYYVELRYFHMKSKRQENQVHIQIVA